MPAATAKRPTKTNGKAHQTPLVQVDRVRMDTVIPHPDNARRGNIPQIASSLAEFGQFKPLVVQKATGYILCGNHTYAAAQALQWTHIDVHYQDIDDLKATRLALADNGTSDLAEWDDQALLDQLRGAGENIPGFDAKFIKDLERQMRALGQGEDPGVQVGRADELAAQWGAAEGQAWTIPSLTRPGESHRLVCGDSTDGEVVKRALAGAKPNLMVTDPPYGVEYDAGWRDEAAKKGLLGFAASRKTTFEDVTTDWGVAWTHFPGNVIYCWHGGLKTVPVMASVEAVGFEVRAQIVWIKSAFAIARGHYSWQHEPCLYAVRQGADPAWKGMPDPDPEVLVAQSKEYHQAHDLCSYAVRDGETAEWIGDHSQSTVWKINHDTTADGGHATQKPLECMERPIRNHEGDVYEPFAGSGTTIVAAERQGRICYAIELLPACMGIILERLKGMGLEPRLDT